MQNNLPAVIETAEQAVEEANRVIQTDLVPRAVTLLRKMLENSNNVTIDGRVTKSYTRLDLEIVKATLSLAGVGRSSQAKGKDPAKMTARELANLLDGAKIINHQPAKSLALED
jgi:hypothetical protein